jgi:hypothetical protein
MNEFLINFSIAHNVYKILQKSTIEYHCLNFLPCLTNKSLCMQTDNETTSSNITESRFKDEDDFHFLQISGKMLF